MYIDLNADMGESFGRYTLGDDAALLASVTSANIACGFHAGDPVTISRTVALAVKHRVAIGAHPAYPDLQGFGRRAMALSTAELEAAVLYQLGALSGFAQACGTTLHHVKAHGALYNVAVDDSAVATAIARAVAAFDPALIVVTLPHSALAQAARELGLAVACEGFADRAYRDDGRLLPRDKPGAVIHDPGRITARALRMALTGSVDTVSGQTLTLPIDTLCLHGDTPGAAEVAAQLRAALEDAGVHCQPLTREGLRVPAP